MGTEQQRRKVTGGRRGCQAL